MEIILPDLLFAWAFIRKTMRKAAQTPRRWYWAAMNFKNYPAEINRRAKVEDKLLDCWRTDVPPTPAECKEWADLLGVPSRW